jgi:hypothetical protein
MMKLTHRYGMKLLCGWLPPVDAIEPAFIVLSKGLSVYGMLAVTPPHVFPVGLATPFALPATAAKVGQGEGGVAIAAIRGSDQLEQRFVLRDWEQLTFAEHPTRGRKVPRKHPDFADVGLRHGVTS